MKASLTIPIPLGYTDTPESRALLCHQVQQKTGQPLQVEVFRNGEIHLAENPQWAPEREILSLSAQLNAQSAAVLDAQARRTGRSLVSYDAASRQAVTAAITPAHRAIRDRIASLARTEPWEIECQVWWRDGHLDRVVVTRAPNLQRKTDNRVIAWAEIVEQMPDGSLGWTVEQSSFNATISLIWGVRPELPKLAPASEVVPQTIDKSMWWNLPLGVDVKGNIAGMNLKLGPHGCTVGPTGSGKSIALLTLMSSCLMRGHSVIVLDPTKGGADFKPLMPWLLAFAGKDELGVGELREAFEILDLAYKEGMRRAKIVLAHGVGGVRDLPDEVIESESLHPISVFVDEYPMLVAPEPEIDGIDKKDPENLEIQERNGYRGRIKHRVLKIAAELRSVNISLQIAAQRADAKYLDGYTRSQLSSVVQIAKPGSIPSTTDLTMVMASDLVPVASELFRTLDDGRSLGIAVIQGDGGAMGAVRIGYAKGGDHAAYLTEKGVPQVELPWVIPAAVSKANPFA